MPLEKTKKEMDERRRGGSGRKDEERRGREETRMDGWMERQWRSDEERNKVTSAERLQGNSADDRVKEEGRQREVNGR